MTRQASSPENFPSLGRANVTLGILVIAFIIAMIDRQILSLMVAPMRASLGISNFQIGLLQGSAFALFYCLLSLPLGRMSDRSNRRNLIAIGMLFWSVATIACAFADSFWKLFLARVFVGVGEAVLAPAGYSLLADSFRSNRLVRANAIFSMGSMMGAGAALLVGGTLLAFTAKIAPAFVGGRFEPWQLVFIVVGIPGVVLSGVLMLFVREPRRVDDHAMPSLAETLRHILDNRGHYFPIYACIALLTIVVYANLGWLPTHLIKAFSMKPGEVGILLGVILIPSASLGTYLGPKFSHWLESRHKVDAHMWTLLIASLAIAISVVAPLIHDIKLQLLAIFMYFLFQNSYFGAVSASLQKATPNRMRAVGIATLFLIANLIGLGGGAALVGWCADNFFTDATHAVGYSVALVASSAALGSALVAAFALRRYPIALLVPEALSRSPNI